MKGSSVGGLMQDRGTARATELADLMARLMMLLSVDGQRQVRVLEDTDSAGCGADTKEPNEGSAVRVVLTVEQAAERLGVGRTLMYSLISSGAVESVTIGRLRRVPADALVRYVEGLRSGGDEIDQREKVTPA
jgi:excisionase family DNA binding protein